MYVNHAEGDFLNFTLKNEEGEMPQNNSSQ